MMGCCSFSAAEDYGDYYRNWTDHPSRKDWEVLQDLGQGAYSAVVLARNVHIKQLAALKIIFLDNPDVDAEMERLLTQEGQLLRQFNHPNIVTCKAIYKGQRSHVLELEVLTGGHVFDKLHGISTIYSERDVAAVFIQIAEAVAYMHRQGVLHRDLKPENVVFSRPPTPDASVPMVKVIDLGMALQYDPLNPSKGCMGTAGFIAPEIVKGGAHSPAMDVYALGVLLFVMMVGRKPYNFSDVEKLKYAYMPLKDAPGLKDPRWLDLSPDAKDLLMGMLAGNPDRRLVMKQVLEHEWVMSKGGLAVRPLGQDVAIGAATVAALRRLRNMGVGAAALPTVVRATVGARKKGSSSSQYGNSSVGANLGSRRQQMSSEHKAFLEALARAKRHSTSSVKSGGVMNSLARSITAKSYQQLHDYSVKNHSKSGPSAHPIAFLDASVHDPSVRNGSVHSTRSGFALHHRPPSQPASSIKSGTDALEGGNGMRRAATSILLTDLLAPSANSSDRGSNADLQALGIPRSRSATMLNDNSVPSGLELLKASVRQYWEVERSVRGGALFSRSGRNSVNGSVHSVKQQNDASNHNGAAGINKWISEGVAKQNASVAAEDKRSNGTHSNLAACSELYTSKHELPSYLATSQNGNGSRAETSTKLDGSGNGSIRVVRRSEESYRAGSLYSSDSQSRSGSARHGTTRKVHTIKALE